jgi:Mg2+/Co2+ transporter CorB
MTTAILLSAMLAMVFLGAGFLLAAARRALAASSRPRLVALERGGNRRARIVNRLLEAREETAGALVVGRAIADAASASLIAGAFTMAFGGDGILYAAIVVSLLTLLFSEVLPRAVAANTPERFALTVCVPLRTLVRVLAPVAAALAILAGRLLRLTVTARREPDPVAPTSGALGSTVDLQQGGASERYDRDLPAGLADLKDLSVADVMIHRTNMFSLDLGEGAEAVVQAVLASPYTRVPVWRESSDNIVGVLHTKDLLRALDAAGKDVAKLDLEEIARPVWFVPATTSLADQLKSFRRRRMHLAVVVDEYGVMLGVVTLEDIFEEIVGDISDEHDLVVTGVRPQRDGTVNVDGSVPIRDLNRAMDWALPDDEATTIAGLVIHEARTIPEAGQTFTFYGFRFQVLRKSRNRITALRVTPVVGG